MGYPKTGYSDPAMGPKHWLIIVLIGAALAGCGGGSLAAVHKPSRSTTTEPTTNARTTTTTELPPTTVPPPVSTTTSEPGLGISVSVVKAFFDAEGPSIQWSTGQPTSYGPKTLGLTSKGNCDIEIDGPNANPYDIELTCVIAGGDTSSAEQASNYLNDAVTAYSGTDATKWLDSQIQTVASETTSSLPDFDAKYQAGSTTVDFQTSSALGTLSVYITAI
jgi:hypothetical protein